MANQLKIETRGYIEAFGDVLVVLVLDLLQVYIDLVGFLLVEVVYLAKL